MRTGTPQFGAVIVSDTLAGGGDGTSGSPRILRAGPHWQPVAVEGDEVVSTLCAVTATSFSHL
jgi:hypothetical protein